jgi:methyl-accepting chemotaxis protein
MNTWTIPRRISFGFLILVLLSLILGGIGLWRVRDINTSVFNLAANAVPSVVMLNKIIQCNNGAAKAMRQLVEQSDNEKIVASARPMFDTQRKEGDALSVEYKKLISDAEDERFFTTADKARTEFIVAAEKAIELSQGQKAAEGLAFMRAEVDPALDRTTEGFNNNIDYNIELAEKEAALAQRKVTSSFITIGTTLALAGLVGTLLGWSISRAVSKSLGFISNSLEESATQTASASGQLSSSSQSLASGCSQQASSVAETSAALEEMSVMIRSTAENAEKAKDFANQARAAAQSGSQTMAEMNTAMHAIEASSAEVAKIVKNIDEIAFQTNILALNAAVEAARAGEAGAGFAVVADEVRSLAQRSAAAAKETAEKIEAAIANSRRGSSSCGKVGESLDEIVAKVSSADAIVAEIATAAKEQSQGIQQVGMTMTQMDKVTQSNAANAEESATAAEELNAQARSMQESVNSLRSLVSKAAQVYQGAASVAVPNGRSRRMSGPAAHHPRIEVAAQARRPAGPQIPMPEEKTSADQDDRHFANF